MSLQEIYDRTPIALQNIAISLAGYQRNLSRYGRAYWQYRRWLENFDTWNIDNKLAYQNAELSRFITDAVNSSPFYRHLYAGIDLRTIRNTDDIARLPIVDKEALRVNMSEIYTVPRRRAVEGHTGGTTGKSLVVRITPEDMMKRMAQLDHFKHRHGFEHRKMRRATFSGKHVVPMREDTEIFWRYNAACKQMLYSTFHLTQENMSRYVSNLNQFKPHALDGFFTSMIDIANYIERNNIELRFRPLAIFPTSETVTETGRALLERVFGARVYDQYASSEGAPFVTECQEGTLHIELASGVFETSDDGEILVTSFTTHATPLIRYRIGDSMSFGGIIDCACGITSPRVLSISGRKDDFLYRADGAKINGGNVANLFKNMPNALIKAQVVQNSMDKVTVLLVADQALYKDEYDELLRDEFKHKFGPQTQLILQHVPDIPREASGKHRLIKNSLATRPTDD